MDSPTANLHTRLEKNMALRLHVLAHLYGDKIKCEDRPELKTIHELEALSPLYNSRGLRQKIIQVAKAIVTICTAHREHDLSVMLGSFIASIPTSSQTHLFFCQNGGPPENDVREHIHRVWSVLREIRAATLEHSIAVDTSTDSPELTTTADGITHLRKLGNVVYAFVLDTALHRAKKRLPSIAALRETMEPPLLDGFEGKLTHLLLTLAKSAMDSNESLFRICTRLLCDMTTSPEYAANAGALQALQAKAQALETHPFNLKRWIEKLLKIETAVLTLYALAVSARRGGIVMCPLIVHNVPLPSGESVEVALCDIVQDWCPPDQRRTAIIEQIRTAAGSITDHITLKARVHSECALVAWTAEHQEEVAPNVTLIPYITSSQRRCFACHLWLESYNESMGPIYQLVSYEESHGGIQPGWWPPPMENMEYTQILEGIIDKLTFKLYTSKGVEVTGIPHLITPLSSLEDHIAWAAMWP
ncbi:hypothetical protein C8J57DRAFT_1715126 [Mycena rebaudengoi]|nr:hypothetical protein C8J57DRAFT_1715126 [Mycena rebaudengoi]